MSTTYDEFPYTNIAFVHSHPDRIATIAKLLGVEAPRLESARVLEFGAASGGNLIPMAECLPGASFLGVELSARQVEAGNRRIAKVGLPNVRLEQRDILELGPELGKFDYIIAHGVFSWVPTAVQEKLLSLCGQLLTSHGIAYVSYNTLPGWRFRGAIRDVMRWQTQQLAGPAQQVQQGLSLFEFVAKAATAEQAQYPAFMQSELEALRRRDPAYLFHEYMEEVNEPLLFTDFVQRAGNHGLRYLGEAELPAMLPNNLPAETQQRLSEMTNDQVRFEQILDIIRCRGFRQTLLCRADVEPSYRLSADRIAAMQVASPAQAPSPAPNIHDDQSYAFVCPNGLSVNARAPILKAAMMVLAESWPRRLPFGKFCSLARARLTPDERLPTTASADAQQLAQTLLTFYATASGVIELSMRPLEAASQPNERPTASPLARAQAEAGEQITNLRQENLKIGAFERELVQRLDGTRDRGQLAAALLDVVKSGKLTVSKEGKTVDDPAAARAIIDDVLEQRLVYFARNSLLLA